MKVRELIAQLSYLDGGMEVFIECDDGGTCRSEVEIMLHNMVKNGHKDSIILTGTKGTEIYIEESEEDEVDE